MTVTKVFQNAVITLRGTLPEVAQALNDEKVFPEHMYSVSYDGTDWVAIYRKS